jgi:hypothetical protein
MRFTLATEANDTTGKTTILKVKSVQIEGQEEVYVFPPEKQPLTLHTILAKTKTVKTVKKQLTTRGLQRKVYVIPTPDLHNAYLDEAENLCFDGEILEEMSQPKKFESMQYPPSASSDYTYSIESTVLADRQKPKSLSSVAKDVILDKFDGTNRNPLTWINTFEAERERLEIENVRFCEVLRLFLEGSASIWYLSTRTLIGTSTWENWRLTFINAFSCRGWNEVCNAIYFRFSEGSLNEYAIRKLALLTNMDPKLSEYARICLTVAGLPASVREKLDRDEVDSVNKLLSKINSLDRTTKPGTAGGGSKAQFRSKPGFKLSPWSPNPCPYCEKRGFKRMHYERDCKQKGWDKERENSGNNRNSGTAGSSVPRGSKDTFFRNMKRDINSNDTSRMVNVTELEEILNKKIPNTKN